MHRLRATKRQLSGTYVHHAADSEATGGPLLAAAAPPGEDFATAWLDLRKGMQAAKDRKRRTLEWCLFEVARDCELSFLRKATCISIMLDESNGWLLIKYSATDCNLEVRVGLFGADSRRWRHTVWRRGSSSCSRGALLHSTGDASGPECRQAPESKNP